MERVLYNNGGLFCVLVSWAVCQYVFDAFKDWNSHIRTSIQCSGPLRPECDFWNFFSFFSYSQQSFHLLEILRATGMMPNHNFSELERLRHRSPSPMASTNSLSNVPGTGLASWNGLQQEVNIQLKIILCFLIYNLELGGVVIHKKSYCFLKILISSYL